PAAVSPRQPSRNCAHRTDLARLWRGGAAACPAASQVSVAFALHRLRWTKETSMHRSRRHFTRSLGAGLIAAPLGALTFPARAQGRDIVLGSLQDMSGPLQPFGRGKSNVLQFGVAQINAAGGLLG